MLDFLLYFKPPESSVILCDVEEISVMYVFDRQRDYFMRTKTTIVIQRIFIGSITKFLLTGKEHL
jgi:hypothetical protein